MDPILKASEAVRSDQMGSNKISDPVHCSQPRQGESSSKAQLSTCSLPKGKLVSLEGSMENLKKMTEVNH